MGLGLSHAEALTYVCAALAEDKSDCPVAPLIAKKAYQMYLSKPAAEDKTGCPFPGLAGYESLKEAGVIDDERL